MSTRKRAWGRGSKALIDGEAGSHWRHRFAQRVVFAPPSRAAEEPVFEIEMKDVITPSRLEVPAKTRFKIIVKNIGQVPAEFESTELRKELVVPPGGTAVMIIRTLDAGEYKFFDEFQPALGPDIWLDRGDWYNNPFSPAISASRAFHRGCGYTEEQAAHSPRPDECRSSKAAATRRRGNTARRLLRRGSH